MPSLSEDAFEPATSMKTGIETLLSADHVELDGLLGKVLISLEGDDVANALDRLDLFWARLAMHIRAEHLHLFPALIAKGARADVASVIEALRADHNFFMRELAASIKLMRGSVENRETKAPLGVVAGMQTLKKRLAEHNKIEEAEIYTYADKAISAAMHEDLIRLVVTELDNIPPRFRGE